MTKETSWIRPEQRPPPPPPEHLAPPPLQVRPRQPRYGPANPAIEAQLDEWVAAKRAKDYAVADNLRAMLQARRTAPAAAACVSGTE